MDTSTGYTVPDLLGSTYLYSGYDGADMGFCFVVGLTMAVDRPLLERALNELMPRFPQLWLKAVKDGDSLAYARRTDPVRVLHVRNRKDFAASGAFGHECLFAVFVHHKTVYFDFHRALTDEKGIVPFVRAVLFHYLRLGGYEVENDGSVITADSQYHDIEADDAFVRLDDIPASRPIWYMDAKSAHVPCGSQEDGYCVTRIHMPLQKVKGEPRQYLSMPSTVVSPFFAQALLEEFPEADIPGEYIVSYIQVNLRQYFPATTFRPFFVNLPLAYNRRIADYPVSTVLMSQKKLLEAQLKTDALAYNAQRRISELDSILGKGSLEDKTAAMLSVIDEDARSATYSLCNIGNVIIPETMLRYITEFYPVVPPALFPFGISTVNFKGDLAITVTSRAGSGVCRRFVSLLQQYDMPAFISETYRHSPLKHKQEFR